MNRGDTTIQNFNTFLAAASQAAGNERAAFIMDNAPCHRRAAEANLNEHHIVRHLPAHSPFLNIVENAISVWKAALKQRLEDVRDQMLDQTHGQRLATLTQLAVQSLDAITPELSAAWWRRVRTLIPMCIMLEDILQDHA